MSTLAFYEAKDIAFIRGIIDQLNETSFVKGALITAATGIAVGPGSTLIEILRLEKINPYLRAHIIAQRLSIKPIATQLICYCLARLGVITYQKIRTTVLPWVRKMMAQQPAA